MGSWGWSTGTSAAWRQVSGDGLDQLDHRGAVGVVGQWEGLPSNTTQLYKQTLNLVIW